jgi:hypothetical protein
MSDMPEETGREEGMSEVAEAQPDGSSSANGTHAEAAIAVAVGEPQAADAVTTEPRLSAEEAAAAEVEAAQGDVAAGPSDDGSGFLAELARAMQATAAVERGRVLDDAERRREAHIAGIHARRTSEADRMRELADEDTKEIAAWAEAERERIQVEQERRAAAVRQDLETSLGEHAAGIDREIEAVETVIATYRADVHAFFRGLERETDPVQIAQHAGRRPSFPDLEAVGAAAGSSAIAERSSSDEATAVGVMDPEAIPAVRWPSEVQPSQSAEGAEPAEAVGAPDATPVADEAREPVAIATTSSNQERSGGLLRSTPSSRPMGWLRRDSHSNNGEG